MATETQTIPAVRRGLVAWGRRHPSVRDALAYAVLSVVGAALGVAGLWSLYSVLSAPASSWWTLATALPASALILLRTRAPWTALALAGGLLVIDALTVGGIVTFVVLLDVLSAATLASPVRVRRRILTGIVAVVGLLALSALVLTGEPRAAVLVALQNGALLGMAYWFGTSQAQANELVALHRQRAADVERLAAQDRADAVRRVREDMARELHDLVAGHVSAMAIRAEAALSAPAAPDPDRAALRAVRDSGLEAHAALRSMIAVLRSGPGSEAVPLRRDAVPALVADARRGGLRVHLDDAIEEVLSLPVDQAVTRIVQEALANCARHAAGAEVRIALVADAGEVRVRVDSRGGAPLAQPALTGSGWGLELLRERARALGGRLQAGPAADGWSVRATLPREVPG